MVHFMRVTMLLVALVAMVSAGAQDAAVAPATDASASPAQVSFTVDSVLDALKVDVRETYTGTLSTVAAGDLVTINHSGVSTQVRLYGIDCPESGQAYADESRDAVIKSVLDTTVSVKVLAIDSQKVPVALIFDGTGNSLSHVLVQKGLAWWDERNAAKDVMLRKLNADAVVAGEGIFSDPAALAPWDYRSSHDQPDFTYTLEKAEPAPEPATAAESKEAPRTISAKGTMTEDRPRAAVAAPPSAAPKPVGGLPISIPGVPDDALKDVDVGGLMMKHQPRIATDDSGRPLGLTANNVGSIPYATQYGFQEGDIISRVNGIPIESEAQIFSLIPKFQNVKSFQVEVLRNGQTVNIPINIK